jgi:hypothetical protein
MSRCVAVLCDRPRTADAATRRPACSQLRAQFEDAGPVRKCFIVKDKGEQPPAGRAPVLRSPPHARSLQETTATVQSAAALVSCSCTCRGHVAWLKRSLSLTPLLCSALPEDAQRAVQLKQNALVFGRKLNVELANQRQPLKARYGAPARYRARAACARLTNVALRSPPSRRRRRGFRASCHRACERASSSSRGAKGT